MDLNANEIHRPIEQTLTFTKYVGGSPANITIAMAKLGLRMGFIGRISDDGFGNYIRSYLKQSDIDVSQLVVDLSGSVTGLAFTEIRSPEECSILMYRDNVADLKLTPADISETYIGSSRALIISGTALAQSPSREAVFQALEYARKQGTTVIFDIDYRPYSWKNTEETYVYCRMVAAQSDIIFGGREEFDLLERSTGQSPDDEATAREWLKERAKLVVVKHGGRGSVAFVQSGERFQAGVFPTRVVKTFGAGDSFAGAFLYALLQDWDIAKCLEWGSAAASIVVSSHSCSDAMPNSSQIKERIAQQGKKEESEC
ncbi:5-dehydro-2-deoxygluconokinase [Paenibacillus nasutitermitis]|uniref:5-dehydro-2-deoxygluconokinase n=2 Tax=Paenibacillus nasutitermitis TaxID=1652958 RepID=A0A917DYV4_9BACL|nr:5-dehydro-2-deoxygluconokinase [Paenibacillus nasutitermitis]